MNAEPYDCICTDPPWPVENNRGTSAGIPGKTYPVMTLDAIAADVNALAAAIPPHGFVALTAPWEHAVWAWANLCPTLVRRKPGVWDKQNPGLGYGFRRGYEMVLLWTGKAWKPRTNLPGVLPVPRGHDRYPTSKPVLLWAYILEAFASPGWIVYDPYAGGGSVKDAAQLLGLAASLRDIGGQAL